jgi:hypothetical protein
MAYKTMNTQLLFAFTIIVSILGWTLMSVSQLQSEVLLNGYKIQVNTKMLTEMYEKTR